ncbi:hypothetical protein NDN08_001611 [Rhodosorus marinus]|uniref:Ubiquitin-like domain-containing protein n=1 Tax=Rhodosorus marinus TaxID=101924 RepID=A0AAV8UUB6_9RHOD|nr:hypothetical protein NDN08_001611 [Rhodosorus marinus]
MDTEEAAPAAASSAPLTLSVKMLDSTVHTVVISQENPQVLDLRREVASVAEVPVERQRLIFRGAVLRDDKSLADYHLENGHVLHLVVKPEEPRPNNPGAPPGAPQPRRRHHHHHHHHHPHNPQGQRLGRPANPIMLRVTGFPRGDNLTFQTRAIGIPRGGNLTFENIRSIVTSVLQALQLPASAAQRGGASAAAAAMTASVHANRRQSGRAHIAQTTLADVNTALDRLGSPQIPTEQLPEDSVEALQFLVGAVVNVQRALIERNEALRGSLPSGVENVANDRAETQRLASAASDFALSANISNGLTGLAAAIVGTSEAERRAASQDQQTGAAENSPDQVDSQPTANEAPQGAAEEQTQRAQQGGVQFQTGFTYESNGTQDASNVVDMVVNGFTPLISNVVNMLVQSQQDGNQGGATGNRDVQDQPVPGETTDQQRTPGDATNEQQAQSGARNQQQGTGSQASQQRLPQVHVPMQDGNSVSQLIPNIAPVIQGILQSLTEQRQRQQAAHQPGSETPADTTGGNVDSDVRFHVNVHRHQTAGQNAETGPASVTHVHVHTHRNPPSQNAQTPRSQGPPAEQGASVEAHNGSDPGLGERAEGPLRSEPRSEPAAQGGPQSDNPELAEYANLFGRIMNEIQSSASAQGAGVQGPSPSVGHLVRNAMEGSSLNSTDESELEGLLRHAMENVSIVQLMGVLNGNFEFVQSMRQPVRTYCLENFTEMDSSAEGADALADRLLNDDLEKFITELDNELATSDRRRPDSRTARERILPILHRRSREIMRCIMDERIQDEEFPSLASSLLDWTVGECAYNLSNMMIGGWPDAQNFIRRLVSTHGQELCGAELGMVMAMGSGLLLRYATDSRGRWIQQLNRSGDERTEPTSVNDVQTDAPAPAAHGNAGVGERSIPSGAAVEATPASRAVETSQSMGAPAEAEDSNLDALLDEVAELVNEEDESMEDLVEALAAEAAAEAGDVPVTDQIREDGNSVLRSDPISSSQTGSGDVFDQYLVPEDAKKWRSLVEKDKIRQTGLRKKPTSRGYRLGGTNKPPPPVSPLTDTGAAEMATTALRKASRSAGVSAEEADQACKELEDSGVALSYNQQLQRSLSSRLASDPDFDPSRFPNASKRFKTGR